MKITRKRILYPDGSIEETHDRIRLPGNKIMIIKTGEIIKENEKE